MIPIVKPFIPPKEELMPLLEKVLYSGYLAQGERVEEFEESLKKYFDVNNLLTVNSGTAALHLALVLLGINENDEVISTPVTAEPTNTTIALTKARVVWADVEPDTGLLSPDSVQKSITSKTKAIVVVHYAGMVADIDAIYEISKKYSIPVIEDCAHAFGAMYKGKKLGYHSDFAIYSFQAIKHVTTIDGGLLIMRSSEYFQRAKKLRWFGLDKTISRLENDITEAGYKYHMNDVNAVIGICQMKNITKNVDEYISNGRYFDANIDSNRIKKISYHKWTTPSYWLYTMLVREPAHFIEYLKYHNISSSQLHKRNDLHSIFKGNKKLPGVDSFYNHFVHIGCGSWIKESRENIVQIINQYNGPTF